MKLVSLAGVATAAVIAAAGLATPSSAADLRGMKDGFAAPLPHVQTGSAGPCYFRADVGYSWSNDPDIKWPVNSVTENRDPVGIDANGNLILDANGNPVPLPFVTTTTNFVTDRVANATVENTWFGEAGAGCAIGGSRGVRFEAMLGYRGDRKIEGEPGVFQRTYTENSAFLGPQPPSGTLPPDEQGPNSLQTSLRT